MTKQEMKETAYEKRQYGNQHQKNVFITRLNKKLKIKHYNKERSEAKTEEINREEKKSKEDKKKRKREKKREK